MNSENIATGLTITGALLLASGGTWILLNGLHGHGVPIFVAAAGFIVLCLGQAVRMLG